MSTESSVTGLWQALEPVLREQGYELVELELARQGRSPLLRFYIDKPAGGITLDDCSLASQVLGPVLDEMELAGTQYFLEVSSPGIARPLRKPEDFERFAGEEIKLVTHAPAEGKKKFTGVLKGFQAGQILLECDGKTYALAHGTLKNAHLNR